MNKDEAQRCLDISKSKFAAGDTEGALKFVKKSLRLHEDPNAHTWVRHLTLVDAQLDFVSKHAHSHPQSQPHLRQRKAAPSPEKESPARAFTQEQVDGIARIRKYKLKGDLYAVLGLKKGATDSEVKKGYRKVRPLRSKKVGVAVSSRQV